VHGHARSRKRSNLRAIDPRDGSEVVFSHHKELAAFEAALAQSGVVFDHQVFDLPAGMSIAEARAQGLATPGYVDSATMRGNLPLDCPRKVRDEIGSFVSALGEEYGLSSDDPLLRDMRSTLGLKLRSLGYRHLSNAQLEVALAAYYPGVAKPTTQMASDRFLVAARVVSPGDRHVLRSYLAATATPPTSPPDLSSRDERIAKLAAAFIQHDAAADEPSLTPDGAFTLATTRVGNSPVVVVPTRFQLPGDMLDKALASFDSHASHRPTVAVWGADGRPESFAMAALSSSGRTQPEIFTAAPGMPSNSIRAKLIVALAAQHQTLQRRAERTRSWCFGCYTDIEHCECRSLAPGGGITQHLIDLLDNPFRTESVEHRWGQLWARRPSAQDHVAARTRTDAIEAALVDGLGQDGFDQASIRLGSTFAYNVSLFATQTGASDDEVTASAPLLVRELTAAADRAMRSHRLYTSILADEFDRPETATVSSQHTEVYLGRDGIYPLIARRAARAASRFGLDPDARRADDATRNQVTYVRVSRMCDWHQGEHTPLLGDHPPVFVDTGFAGSIPKKILTAEGVPQEQVEPQFLGSSKSPFVRLFSATDSQFAFATQLTENETIVIEHDAKPDQTAYAVNASDPASALEQLVYRQLRHSIIEVASRDTFTNRRVRGEDVSAPRGPLRPPTPAPTSAPASRLSRWRHLLSKSQASV
jgi:hypothetical protein